MKRMLGVSCVCLGLGAVPVGAQTVTQPSAQTNVAAAQDFATTAFQNPWDMSERTDFGWFLHGTDQPLPGLSNISFAGGIFSGTITSDPNLFLLETGLAGAAQVGKIGTNYPIATSMYQRVAIRMNVSQAAFLQFFWSTNTIYDPPGLQSSNGVETSPGWRYYFIDLATLGLIAGSEDWLTTPVKRALRFDPSTGGGIVQIDWIRLTNYDPALVQTVQWTAAGGNVDIYLVSPSAPPTNDPSQLLGLVDSNVPGNSYQLYVGALAPGDYKVAIRRTGTTGTFAYSPGFYRVNAPPILTVTSPSPEGSSDDFATIQLNNPWDMTSASDVDVSFNVAGGRIGTVVGAETPAGVPLGNVTGFVGASTPGITGGDCGSVGDPVIYPLNALHRGANQRIDTSRYRILTANVGIPNTPRNVCNGSVVRVVWYVAGEAQETVSEDIVLNSRVGANVLDTINLDMAALPIDPGSPGRTPWSNATAGVSSFRIDPHEFVDPTSFYVTRVKLAALETAHTSYTVRWTSSKTNGTVNVYYDTDKNPSVKTFIGQTSAPATSLVWNTANLSQGQQYFVYVEFSDGININGTYSKWPIVINHAPISSARLVLNRSTLNFGVTAQTVKTPPQTIALTTLNGVPCWSASSDLSFLTVSPASSCGSAVLTVSLVNQAYGGQADYSGAIRVTSTEAINSPQLTQTVVRVRVSSAPPGGFVDTPANGVTVTGSVGVTGWAIDDIGVSRVAICRAPVAGEAGSHPACGPNQIFVGDAVSIEDARPDIAAYSPTTPLNYRAGWGFLVLTNTLPFQGNGAFTLYVHAIDLEGQRTVLGSRVINAQNGAAVAPFGTIDTPGQGETISGSNYANFGWVLSRVRRADPPGGGTVTAYIDGVAIGNPCCWTQRSDLSAVFPGYPGINTALGVLGFNTFAYGNGLHTIVWVVTDSGGVSSGVGSRYFTIFNSGVSATLNTDVSSTVAGVMRPIGPDLGRLVEDLGPAVSQASVAAREGFRLTMATRPIAAGPDGVRRVRATERDRLEIRLPSSAEAGRDDEYAGYLLVDGRLRELPIGSSFDPVRRAFYWQPGLGYIGDYDFVFVRTRAGGARERTAVRVTLEPRPWMLAASLRSPWAGIDFLRQ
jgi:hypothetical protein